MRNPKGWFAKISDSRGFPCTWGRHPRLGFPARFSSSNGSTCHPSGLFRGQLSRLELRTCFDTSGSGHICTSSLTWGPNKNGGDRDELFEAKSFKVFAHQWTYSMWTWKALITHNTSYGDKSRQVIEYIAPVRPLTSSKVSFWAVNIPISWEHLPLCQPPRARVRFPQRQVVPPQHSILVSGRDTMGYTQKWDT